MKLEHATLCLINNDLNASAIGFLQIAKGQQQYEIYYQPYTETRGEFMVRCPHQDRILKNYIEAVDMQQLEAAFNSKTWQNGAVYFDVFLKDWE